MSTKVRADKQLAIAVMGFGSVALTGIILGFLEATTGFAIYSLMLWFIIPIGALLAGFGAASGYYFGAKMFHQKPAGGVAVNMILASIAAYLLVHYVPYYFLEVDGTRIKDTISFWHYLDIDIRHTSLSYKRSISTGELGSIWGYLYAIVQLIGFAIGGLSVFGLLLDAPFCAKCSKYLTKSKTQNRYTSEAETLPDRIATFQQMLQDKKYSEAIQFHADEMGIARKSGHHLKTRLVMHKCQSCKGSHLNFETSRLEEGDWKDIKEAKIELWVDSHLI
jgi:DNA-directed RNA polymerase subunit M/transcription elongation factor TFIIS